MTTPASSSNDQRFEGVYHVLCTPFTSEGELDLESLTRLTDTVVDSGVDGLTVLGVMGEAHKLTEAECEQVLETVTDVANGRVSIIVGASQKGTVPAIAAGRRAVSHGAAALMVAPPISAGAALTDHYRRIVEEVGVPIVLQDYPAGSGVELTVAAIVDLIEQVPEIVCVKLESPPTGRRSAALLSHLGDRVTVLGGLGAVYLADELRHGTHGTMTGMAYPEGLLKICSHWSAGETEQAFSMYVRLLPLLVADSQPTTGLSFRKHMWVERGVLSCPDVRSPGAQLTEIERAQLHETLATIGLEISRAPPDAVRTAM